MGQASIADIVSNQGPVQAAAVSPVPPTSAPPAAGGIAHVDDIVSNQGPAQPSGIDAANQWAFHTPLPKPAPVEPPTDHKEELVNNIAGERGLAAYRAARDNVMLVENLVKSPPGMYQAAKQGVQGIADNIRAAVMPEQNPDVIHQQMLGAPLLPIPGAAVEAGETMAATPRPPAPVKPFTPPTPSVGSMLTNPFKKLLTTPKEAGAAATQEPAAAAVRTAVGAPAGAPIIEGASSVADDLLSKVGVQKDVAYKAIDDAVGFDLKAEKQALSDARYQIRQPGVDKVQIQKEIDESMQRIADANKILVERGINPKVADQLNTSWEAAKTIKNDIVKSTASDGTINVKQLLTRAKNARFNARYGDRLAQAFGQGDAAAGKAIADQYISGLEAAQQAGVDALRAQRFKLWLTGLVGGAALTTGGVEGVKALLAP